MNRRDFVMTTALASLAGADAAPQSATVKTAGARAAARGAATAPGDLTVAEIGAAYAQGKLTAAALTRHYLERIDKLDRRGPELRAVLETNPAALQTAAALDEERRGKGPRGPLHGVPLLIKDNVETADRMMTTAGSLALEGWYAPQDAPLIARLRAAGAVILGKSNLSEWANFRSTHSLSGWSGRGGQCRNPFALDRSPSGSSSGSAVGVAADLCAAAVGSETDGSIIGPASVNGVVGIKPTLGLVSRSGVVPLSHSQDTAGPLAKSVWDAALLLTAMAGADPADPASAAAAGRFDVDYTRHVQADGLRGARLGVARKFFENNAPLNRLLDERVALLRRAGAIIVDPADLPMHGEADKPEQDVLLYDFKHDINAYLARLPGGFRVRTLEDLIRFNDTHAAVEMPLFDQELFRQSQAKGGLEDAAYAKAREACLVATRTKGIDAVLAEHKLDAIVSLSSGPAWLIDPVFGDYDTGGCTTPAAVAGYPHVSVPAGLYQGLPIGLSFFGAAFSEPTLIRLAAGFEHVAGPRPLPAFAAHART